MSENEVCWAFNKEERGIKITETFKQHSLGTLKLFRASFSYIIPILNYRYSKYIGEIDEDTVRKSVEIGVALHDIGKTSKNYTESYTGHELYSGYQIYKILEECCDSGLKAIVSIAAMSHHQAMVNRTLKEHILKGGYEEIRDYELREECIKDISDVLKEIGVNIDAKNIIQPYITRDDVYEWFINMDLEVNNNLNFYTIIVGPLMIVDTIVANMNRGGGTSHLIKNSLKWIEIDKKRGKISYQKLYSDCIKRENNEESCEKEATNKLIEEIKEVIKINNK